MMKKNGFKYLGVSAMVLLNLSPLVNTVSSVAYAKANSVENVANAVVNGSDTASTTATKESDTTKSVDGGSTTVSNTETNDNDAKKGENATTPVNLESDGSKLTESDDKTDGAPAPKTEPLALTRDLVDNAVSYTANGTEYAQGAHYEGTIKLTNDDGNEIPAGSQIVLNIPSSAVDYNTLDLSDPQIKKFFDVTTDKVSGKIIFTVKTDIVGQVNISFVIGGTVIGVKGQNYPVSVSAVDSSGSSHSVINNNPSLSVKDDGTNPPPVYGMVNAFWGKGPNETGQFIGKNTEDIEGLPTGRFSRSSDEVQNFVQINPQGTYQLSQDYHYLMAWVLEPYSGNATVNIDLNDIKVYNDGTGNEIDKSWYTVSRDGNNPNEVWVEFKSPKATGGMMGSRIRLRVSLDAHVSNDAITYHSNSYVYVKTDAGGIVGDTYEFPLNNIFTNEGESTIFPNLKVEDKTFYVDYLNDENIEKELLKNITAKDTVDGDISRDIKVDFSKVSPNAVGDYEVTYSVTNSTGHISTKTAIVHIIERKAGAPVTVKYVDEDGKSISPDVVLQGKVDESYETTAVVKDGYELISTPDNAKGVFTEEKQTVTYVYRGHLVFVDAPKVISFGEHALSDKDETYFMENKKDDLKVQDFRKLGSTWSLTAQLKSNFIGEKFNKELNGSLNYTDSKGQISQISTGESTLIYSAKTEDHEVENLSENWSDKEGLSLNVKTGGALLDKYNANIEWTVSDTVPNE